MSLTVLGLCYRVILVRLQTKRPEPYWAPKEGTANDGSYGWIVGELGMAAAIVFLSRQDAIALASVLGDAVAELNSRFETHSAVVGDMQTPIDYSPTRTALAKLRKAAGSALVGVWPDLTGEELRAAGTWWEELAFTRPDIGDGQFERVRQQLAG